MSDEQLRIETVYDERDRSGRDRKLFGYEGSFHVGRVQERLYKTLRLFKKVGLHDLASIDILDADRGEGSMLRQFFEWGASLVRVAGSDIRPAVAERARALSPSIAIRLGSAEDLLWKGGYAPAARFKSTNRYPQSAMTREPDQAKVVTPEKSHLMEQGVKDWCEFTQAAR
jgi:hypothetical protein